MRFLFVDRILAMTPGVSVSGIKHITASDAFLTHNHLGQICFMPSMIGETLGQLAAWNVMQTLGFTKRPVAGVVSAAHFYESAKLGDTLCMTAVIDSLDDSVVSYHGEVRVRDKLVFALEGALGPMLPMDDFIDEAVVRRQFAEIYRLGDWPPVFEDLQGLCAHPVLNHFFAGFDAILQCEPGVGSTAVKRISHSAGYFADHFPNKPVLPMTLLLECSMNWAQDFVKQSFPSVKYQVQRVQKIKMNDFVTPGDEIRGILSVKNKIDPELLLTFRHELAGKRVCTFEVLMKQVDDE